MGLRPYSQISDMYENRSKLVCLSLRLTSTLTYHFLDKSTSLLIGLGTIRCPTHLTENLRLGGKCRTMTLQYLHALTAAKCFIAPAFLSLTDNLTLSAISNETEPKIGLGRAINSKLACFVNNPDIVQHIKMGLSLAENFN
jgi:hypothetical protein